jgi:NhaP-type Na+/H+ or K+/H+ antiporter
MTNPTKNIEQEKWISKLTWLAVIYLPLSLVTGIFGMNLKQINDGRLSFWVVFIALLALWVCTWLMIWVYDVLERRRDAAGLRKQSVTGQVQSYKIQGGVTNRALRALKMMALKH